VTPNDHDEFIEFIAPTPDRSRRRILTGIKRDARHTPDLAGMCGTSAADLWAYLCHKILVGEE